MELSNEFVGRRVEIHTVQHYPEHADMIGKTGLIVKAIKSRKIFRVKLEGGKYWESYPRNLNLID